MNQVDINTVIMKGNEPAYPAEVMRHYKEGVLIAGSPLAEKEGPYMHTQSRSEMVSYPGLTKREMFAMVAMQGILANRERDLDYETAAKHAVRYADELLKQLES